MGSGGAQTTTTSSQPWKPQQQYLKMGFQQAEQLLNTPLQQFGPSTVAGQSAMSQEGQQAGLGLVRNAGQGAEFDYMNQVLGGQFLDPNSNPYLRSLADQGASDITRQFQTAVMPGTWGGGMGRVGSGASANMQKQSMIGLGDALQKNYSRIYGQNFQQERDRMQQGVGLMNQMRQGQRSDIMTGTQLGGGADAFAQAQLNDQIQKFNFLQQEPESRLDRFQQRITGGGVIPGRTQGTVPGQQFGPAQGIGAGIGVMGLMMSCSREWKEELDRAQPVAVLEALEALPIPIWRYEPEAAASLQDHEIHMGPYAEDFKQVTDLGDGKVLSVIDVTGIALAAVKGAGEKIKALEARLTALEPQKEAA